MLQLYDLDHNKINGLTNYKNLKVERSINTDEILSFLYPSAESNLQEEFYIRTKENEYVIKEINISDGDWVEAVCKINLETIKGNYVSSFETIGQTCTNAVNLALAGTGWTIGTCDVTKLRTTRRANVSSYVILLEIQNTYACEMSFDAINKKVNIYKAMGNDKGVYFSEQLNLKKLEVQSNSYDYITRLIPVGKDGLNIASVNGNINYLENYQYSNKIITAYWEDNRYTVAEDLKEDGIARLDYLSMPYKAYKANVIDLACINTQYSILDYSLGDTITLLSKSKNTKEKQRIIKITEYPEEPEKNACEIANKLLRLEDLQVRFQDTTNTVDSVTTSSGSIDGSKIDSIEGSIIQNLHIVTANIDDLNVVTARIGTLETTKANITDLTATNAEITNLTANKANITDLTATKAKITNLETKTATIDALLAGNLTADNIQAGTIQVGSAIIADGAIGNGKISDLDVSKLNAGTIDTTKIDIASPDGRMIIKDNSILTYDYKDNDLLKPFLRTQQGRIWDVVDGELVQRLDTEGKPVYGFEVKNKNGQTTMIDGDGVHNEGIKDGAVDNSKISPNAKIDGAKLDIATVVNSINDADGSTTIQGSKIFLDNKTLDVKIQEIETNVNYKVEIISANGQAFKNGIINTTLYAKVYKGGTDVTSTFPNNGFAWHKTDKNGVADLVWDSNHISTKQVNITALDVSEKATFTCDVSR